MPDSEVAHAELKQAGPEEAHEPARRGVLEDEGVKGEVWVKGCGRQQLLRQPAGIHVDKVGEGEVQLCVFGQELVDAVASVLVDGAAEREGEPCGLCSKQDALEEVELRLGEADLADGILRA